MDFKQEQFMRMQQYQFAPKMPFYMSYPMQNIYMTEMDYDRDMERMKELYPEEAKRIQKLVEEECDQMEYEGSMMFDEYPDRLMLKVICERIYQNAMQPQIAEQELQPDQQLPYHLKPAAEQEALSELNGQQPDQALSHEQALSYDQELSQDQGLSEETEMTHEQEPVRDQVLTAEQVEEQNYRRGPGRPPGPPPPGWGPPPPPGWRPPPPPPGRPPHNPGLGNLIEVLLYNEMYNRRCRHNRCRRWW